MPLATRSPNTISALTNNGTEKDRTNTWSRVHAALTSDMLLETRGQYSREERPRDANALQPLITGTVGNVGTVSFLGENIQSDWRAQAGCQPDVGQGRTHSVKVGLEYNHVDASRRSASTSSARFRSSRARHRPLLEIPERRRRDRQPFRLAPVRHQYRRQIGNLASSLSDRRSRVLRPGQLESSRRTSRSTTGLRWEGAFNPTPEANNEFMLNAAQRHDVSRSAHGVDPTQIPEPDEPVRAALGFAWDSRQRRPDRRPRLPRHLLRAHAELLFYASPMNNFRVPPGDLSLQLPLSRCRLSNPNNTVYQQLLLIGIDLNAYSARQLPHAHDPSSSRRLRRRSASRLNPYFGAQPLVRRPGLQEPARDAGRRRIEREVRHGFSARRRRHLREDRPPRSATAS